VLTSALLLLSFICSFLHLGLCIGLLALSCLAWMITGVLTAQMLNQDNVSGKFWLSYVIGAVLVIVVGYYVMPGLFLKAAGGIAVTAAGVTTTMQMAFQLAANKANVCFIGTPTRDLTFTPKLFENMNRKEFKLTGSWMSYSAPFPGKEWEMTAHYFGTGQLKYDPAMIFRKYPLSQAAEAFDLYHNPAQVKGRVMLVSEE